MAKVFLVDDDVDLVEQNTMVLKENGYEVVSANTAREGIETLAQMDAKPDIIVADVMMEHNRAGFEFARELGKKYADIPLIIMSGDPHKENWYDNDDSSTWDSVIRFLDKPVSPDKLVKEIGEVLKNG